MRVVDLRLPACGVVSRGKPSSLGGYQDAPSAGQVVLVPKLFAGAINDPRNLPSRVVGRGGDPGPVADDGPLTDRIVGEGRAAIVEVAIG